MLGILAALIERGPLPQPPAMFLAPAELGAMVGGAIVIARRRRPRRSELAVQPLRQPDGRRSGCPAVTRHRHARPFAKRHPVSAVHAGLPIGMEISCSYYLHFFKSTTGPGFIVRVVTRCRGLQKYRLERRDSGIRYYPCSLLQGAFAVNRASLFLFA